MKLSEQAARDLEQGGVLKDHVVAGLELRAKATGRFWFLYYRAAGQQRRPKLGSYPALSVSAARELARDWHLRIAGGEDPSADRRALRDAPSVSQLADRYLEEYARVEYKPTTLAHAEYMVRMYVKPMLGKLRTAEVSTEDVEAMLHKLRDRPATANRARAYVSKLFTLAERWKLRPAGTNPVKGTDKRPEQKRRRFATSSELRSIGEALDHFRETYPGGVAALFCLVYSGARVSELTGARRADLSGSTITLRDHKAARTGNVRTIRLPRQALDILATIPPGEFLFGRLDRYGVRWVWKQVCKRAGVTGLTVHDLRRTFATFVRSGGGNLDIAGALLGHSDMRTTQGYAYLFDDGLDAAAQSAADQIEAAMTGKS